MAPAKDVAAPSTFRSALAEFIKTLLFIFLGAGTVVVTGGLIKDGLTSARLVAIAFAHGLAIALLASATARVSGGHINPAVTFAAFITGKIDLNRAIADAVAQVVGAVVGALLLAGVIPAGVRGNLGAHA